MDIDLIYLWVDGNDPAWQAKRSACLPGGAGKVTESTTKARYADNEELKYSLRSAEKHAPWIRNIFIVTDNQTPAWLDTSNPRVKVVNQSDIMPAECDPCFNSSVIEYYLYRIPGLSEHFIYANDDMFFNADVQPDFFFGSDGYPIVRLKRKRFGKLLFWLRSAVVWKKPGIYRVTVQKASEMVGRKFGKYYSGVPHHNIDAYNKSDYREAVEDVFRDKVEATSCNRFRTAEDMQRIAILYYALAIGHGHLRYAGRRESKRISAHREDFMEELARYRPTLLCLNDSQRVKDSDRDRIKPFLEQLFPEKSSFEK